MRPLFKIKTKFNHQSKRKHSNKPLKENKEYFFIYSRKLNLIQGSNHKLHGQSMEDNILHAKLNHLFKHLETNQFNIKNNAKLICSWTGQSKDSSTP